MNLLDLLAATDRPLSAVVAELPEPHIAHETVPTPWERKGTVMRGVVERAKDRDVVLVDGVKILYPDGWALVLPDPEGAGHARVGRGGSDADARRLVAIHAGHVAELTRCSDASTSDRAGHEHSRRASVQRGARVGARRRRRARRVGITDFAQDASATSSSCSCPTSAPT